MTFGEKLKEARQRAGLSQEQLSEKLHVSRSAVAKWETDKGMPDIENLKATAQLLDVSIDYLLRDDYNEDADLPPSKEVRRAPMEKEQKQRKFYLVACICWVIAAAAFLIAAIDRMSIHLVMLVFVDVILAIVFLWKYIKSEPKE